MKDIKGNHPDEEVNVLIVDDDKKQLHALEKIVSQLDITIHTANSGQEALKKMLHNDFILILLDIVMPGMDGMEVAQLMRQKESTKNTPIIFISAYTKDEIELMKAYELGAIDYIIKPVNESILLSKVGIFIDQYEHSKQKARLALVEELEEKNKKLDNARLAALNMLEDATDAREAFKKAKIALEESEQRYRLATTASDSGIWDWYTNSDIIFFSDTWKAQLGYAPSELKNNFKTWENLLHPECKPQVLTKIKNFLKSPEEYFVAEFRMKHKNGSYVWIYNKAASVLDSNGNVTRMFGTHTDITDRKNFELDLIEAKKKADVANIYKNQFLANMSHEIRTPLNGVLGFADLLKEENLTHEERSQYIDIIKNGSSQLLNLINDIIDISKLEVGELKLTYKPCGLNKLLLDIEAMFEQIKINKKKQDLNFIAKTSKKNENFCILTDATRLEQVIMNLVGNSLKFSEKGNVEFGYNIKDDKVVFYVQDEGIGIPKDKIDLIFARFEQLHQIDPGKNEGTGLGLAISKGIIELLNGTFHIESEIGKGTKISFTLPNTQCDLPAQIEKEIKYKELEHRTILIAEDEPINIEYYKSILKNKSLNVIYAYDGMEAVELYKSTDHIDVVLMDIKMPKLNGVEAAKQIHKINPAAKIIAQTAYAMANDADKYLNNGFVDYISKPINKKLLFEKMQKALH